MTPESAAIASQIAPACAAAGFDLLQPFSVGWYNGAVEPEYRLPDFGRAGALGLLIGHSRAVWAAFVAAVRADPALRNDANPLDRYTERSIGAAVAALEHRCEVRWTHDGPPRRVAMQRLGHVSGLAHLSRAFLNVHPVYGPWIALRAAVVLDVEGPAGPAPDPPTPCADCAGTCLERFQEAAAALAAHAPAVGLGDTWPLWLAVRDACPLGRAHRYGEEQIAYHYRNDRSVLI